MVKFKVFYARREWAYKLVIDGQAALQEKPATETSEAKMAERSRPGATELSQ